MRSRSAGTFFRRDYGNLVQVAMSLLEQNSARDIPTSAGAEREQKALLSQALTSFLQSCSGPAQGRGGAAGDEEHRCGVPRRRGSLSPLKRNDAASATPSRRSTHSSSPD